MGLLSVHRLALAGEGAAWLPGPAVVHSAPDPRTEWDRPESRFGRRIGCYHPCRSRRSECRAELAGSPKNTRWHTDFRSVKTGTVRPGRRTHTPVPDLATVTAPHN